MTRIDGKGGSRIVACPECKAAKGEHCMDYVGPRRDDYAPRRNSHVVRVNKATALIEKSERAKRISPEETRGARHFRNAVEAIGFSLAAPGHWSGQRAARDAALAAIDRLLKTRGAR